ncbi:hypothetical protein BCL90_0342 [Pedobacter alluvionis]|uniref:Uncharacterized protein n=1 Tax=Pedobacter alluvionis TaxID=475253 RepID=A0A497Y8W4_9SPHI|nr:hypothetical protein BCL90_0342 [Pedobacter alluvionis]
MGKKEEKEIGFRTIHGVAGQVATGGVSIKFTKLGAILLNILLTSVRNGI